MIKAITVRLYSPVVATPPVYDDFGDPVTTETHVDVPGVLVYPTTADAIVTDLQIYGKRSIYELCIPKGDAHDWTDVTVSWTDAYGRTITCETFGFPITGVEHLVPTPWHMKVRCHRIE